MPHPNQQALAMAAERWIDQSQDLTDNTAVERLTYKINTLQDGIHELSLASIQDREPDESLTGLSVIDIMAAQSRLVVERNVRMRGMGMRLAA
ncbi:hypothetical protein [Brevundimonas sp.]|uniref:hypothetical protein n=1 Tax=Brevundimonas sp. TaxID=1871086 RepID=UPI0025C1BE52|nr:hypothetical protein [Brevundimonas sp.]